MNTKSKLLIFLFCCSANQINTMNRNEAAESQRQKKDEAAQAQALKDLMACIEGCDDAEQKKSATYQVLKHCKDDCHFYLGLQNLKK